jgi:hypothetical protein
MISAAWTAFKGSKFMGYLIVAVAAIGAVVLVLARAFGAGKAAERSEELQRTVEIQKRITDADAAGPRTADDVDKRLSDGTF